jgi:ATP-dependent protease ClpP protease subunit
MTDTPTAVELAEAEKFLAEAAKFREDATLTRINQESHKLNLAQMQEIHAFNQAGDLENNVYRFRGGVGQESVTSCVSYLTRWSRLNPGADMTVIFNSPGGTIHDGMELFDTVLELRAEGHLMTGIGRGMVASMGSILLQAFDWRVMGPGCYMLVHQPSGGTYGTLGEIEDTKAWFDMMAERILDTYAERCAGSGAEKPYTRQQLKRGWDRHNWWIDSDTCLKAGLIDEIR